MIRAVALTVALGMLFGCAGGTPHAFTQEALAQRCVQTGGWWHPDDLMGGICEYESGGFQ